MLQYMSIFAADCNEARLQRRNQKRKRPRIYHQRVVRPDGSTGWQGGKHLPLSAAYTSRFCQAVFSVWLSHIQAMEGPAGS